MKKSIVLFILILMILVMTVGCKGESNLDCREDYFVSYPASFEEIPIANIDMTLEVLEQFGPYKIGDPVYLWIENHSDENIIITLEEQVEIWRVTDEENVVEQIKNMTTSLSPTIVLEPAGSNNSGSMLLIDPDINNLGKKEEIIVNVTGNEYRDELYCSNLYYAQVTFYLSP